MTSRKLKYALMELLDCALEAQRYYPDLNHQEVELLLRNRIDLLCKCYGSADLLRAGSELEHFYRAVIAGSRAVNDKPPN
jgi:hypothetical protein